MSNKNMLIVFLITMLFLSPIIFCKELCDSLREHPIDSALSLDDKLYLFQNQEIWLFDPEMNSTPILKGKIDENFDSTVVDNGKTYNMERIDAITQLPIHQTGNQNEDRLRLIFANYGRRYWFFIFGKCEQQNRNGNCFRPLHPNEKQYIPTNMEYSSGRLFDWYPKQYDDLLALDQYLFIFFDRSTQVVELPKNMIDKWDNDPGVISFGGDMRSVVEIDAVFQMPLSEDIVIVKSNKYCRFNRNHLLSAVYFQTFLKISCQWSTLSALLNCPDLTDYYSSEKTTTQNETNRYTTADSGDSFGPNSIIIMMLFIIVIFVIVIVFILVLITFFMGIDKRGKSSSVATGLSLRTRSLPDDLSTVVTVDSNTGKKLENK